MALAIAFAFAALATTAGEPRAGAQPAKTEERRTQLFNEGKQLFEAGKLAQAAEKFREVIAIRSAPRALIALGLALENQGKYLEARGVYAHAFTEARDDNVTEDMETIKSALGLLAQKIPTVTVRAPGGVPDVEVRVDGAIAQAATAVDVDPGAHTIVVTAPNATKFEATVRVADAEHRVLDATIALLSHGGGKPSGSVVVPLPPPSRSWSPPIATWVVSGVGLVAMGAGAAFWTAGRSKEDDVRARCPNGGTDHCPSSAQDDASSARDTIVGGNVAFACGVAFVAIGGGIWIVSAATSKSAPSVAIAPRLGGATVFGTF